MKFWITGGVNNRKLEAQVGRALTDGSAIIHFEYTNAGNNYTNATYTITGAGYGAVVANATYVNGALFEVRLRNPDDGSTYNTDDVNNDGVLNDPDTVGGRGYVFSENTAQGGTATTITPFNTETANSSKIRRYESCYYSRNRCWTICTNYKLQSQEQK